MTLDTKIDMPIILRFLQKFALIYNRCYSTDSFRLQEAKKKTKTKIRKDRKKIFFCPLFSSTVEINEIGYKLITTMKTNPFFLFTLFFQKFFYFTCPPVIIINFYHIFRLSLTLQHFLFGHLVIIFFSAKRKVYIHK